MPRSELSLLVEELDRELGSGAATGEKIVDMGARLRVWECSCGRSHIPPDAKNVAQAKEYIRTLQGLEHHPVPGRLIPGIFGGKYDRRLRKYIGRPEKVHEISCHEGQLPVLTLKDGEDRRVLALGSPGAGKTFAALRYALLEALRWPNTNGALIAAIGDRRQILWDEFIGLVEPLGWIEGVALQRKQIRLINGVKIDVLAAKAGSRQTGNPLQGRSWDWVVVDESQNVDDRAHREIAARGRRNAKRYRIIETATNEQYGPFLLRKRKFGRQKGWRLVKLTGFGNPWVGADWWTEFLAGEMDEREYAQFILGEDLAPELRLYHDFDDGRHIGPIPRGAKNITADVAYEATRRTGVQWLGFQDFGTLVTCTEFAQCFEVTERDPAGLGYRTKRIWVARDELTSGAGVTADIHARRILQKVSADRLLVVADPHFNTKDTDKSDYRLFEKEGIHIIPASHTKIPREHRYTMMNVLFREDRILLESDANGSPRCPKLAGALLSMERNELGEGEKDRKDKNDQSHWPAAFGYGVYPWEKIRGQGHLRAL